MDKIESFILQVAFQGDIRHFNCTPIMKILQKPIPTNPHNTSVLYQSYSEAKTTFLESLI